MSAFRDGSRFSDIIALYVFDRALRQLAVEAIELIEPAVQTRLAYRLGKYDAFAHEKAEYWHIDARQSTKLGELSRYQAWQVKYQALLAQSARKTFVQHNFNTYGGLPIWVAIEIFDFGAMSKLYAGMRDGDRDFIAQSLNLKGAEFTKWLRALNFIRNQAAHHGRLWNCDMLEKTDIPSFTPFTEDFKEKARNRTFLYFCIMQHILKTWKLSEKWGEDFKTLLKNFPKPENKAVSLADMGLASDWEN